MRPRQARHFSGSSRFYIAFFVRKPTPPSATPRQKSHLRGFSLELLGVAVRHAIGLEALLAEHEGRAAHNDISTASRDASAQEAFRAGLTLREPPGTR